MNGHRNLVAKSVLLLRVRKLNARILALALILVFTQKPGLCIWMHNWLHETGVLSDSSLPSVDRLHAS